MGQIKTITDLQDCLDKDLGWRTKELANLIAALKTSRASNKAMLLRASIALVYAHWEGFIKQSSTDYLDFVNSRRLKYHELQNCFVFLGLKKHLNEAALTKQQSLGQQSLIFLRERLSESDGVSFKGAVRTESNLNSENFENIACSIGISTHAYKPYYKLMDERLLAKRNKIAHGEYLELDVQDVEDTTKTVNTLLRWYKTDIENAASLESYKLPTDS